MTVYVVVSGPIIHGIYERADLAHIHMRCVTGAHVIAAVLRSELPRTVLDQISDDNDNDNDPTPVTAPFKRPVT